MEYQASQTKTRTLTRNGLVADHWHARAVIDGLVAPTSICGVFTWRSAAPVRPWNDSGFGLRCNACQAKIADPSPFGEADLWDKNGLECGSLCVVCARPAASYITGPHQCCLGPKDMGCCVPKKASWLRCTIVARTKVRLSLASKATCGKPLRLLSGTATRPTNRASGRGELHPPALSEPDVTVSRHPAPTGRPRSGGASCQ